MLSPSRMMTLMFHQQHQKSSSFQHPGILWILLKSSFASARKPISSLSLKETILSFILIIKKFWIIERVQTDFICGLCTFASKPMFLCLGNRRPFSLLTKYSFPKNTSLDHLILNTSEQEAVSNAYLFPDGRQGDIREPVKNYLADFFR